MIHKTLKPIPPLLKTDKSSKMKYKVHLRHFVYSFVVLLSTLIVSDASLNIVPEYNEFTFNHPTSYLELRPYWPLGHSRELSFKFRTHLTHALLMYHSVIGNTSSLFNYELYIELENAQLKVIHILHSEQKTLFSGHALNTDQWHSIHLVILPDKGELTLELDGEKKTESFSSNYTYENTYESIVYFGGMDASNLLWDRQYSYTNFQGCIRNITFKVIEQEIKNLTINSYRKIIQGCKNKCQTSNYCLYDSRCINRYSDTVCDCFNSGHEGEICSRNDLTTVTIRGYSYITYKIYDWDDKVHSDSNRISITFRSIFDNSILFYAMGKYPIKNYIAVTIISKRIHFVVNFGDGDLEMELGKNVVNDWWRTFTMQQIGRKIILTFAHEQRVLNITGKHYYMHLDPPLYVGGVPEEHLKQNIKTKNYFVGSLKEVYFNSISILERLKNLDHRVSYHGVFGPDYQYKMVDMMPLTFPFKESFFFLRQRRTDSLHLKIDFKTTEETAILATANVTIDDVISGYWELSLENGTMLFSFKTPNNKILHSVNTGRNLNSGLWHYVALNYQNGKLETVIDYREKEYLTITKKIKFSQNLVLAGHKLKPDLGFVGCMREIYLDDQFVDPRSILNEKQFEGLVTMDNCRLIDPCKKPNQCEHGGQCYTVNGQIMCNCDQTGYIGKTCHFSLFKRTCEELFLVGQRKPDIYTIDIDGNGPHKPSAVRCEIDENRVTTTIVDHNLNHNLDVRGLDIGTFRVEIKYRDFTPEMLQTLIDHSKSCTQHLKYECHKAPLGLKSLTWFKSSYSKNTRLTSFGSSKDTFCPCGETRTCENKTLRCNCDANDGAWRTDEVDLNSPKFLGITEMYFLQPEEVPSDSTGHILLGPLKCIEMDTQHYVVTFRTSDSYLQVPGWREGDLDFSFRTSSQQAVLLYQPSPMENTYFRVLLVNAYVLHFEYTVDGNPRSMKITSRLPLNSGEWQQVWVDYDTHHVRFTLNMDYEMIDLTKEEHFGPFEGPLYIGGAPTNYLDQSPIKEGFVGCFRGLVINEEIVNLHYYLSSRTPQVVRSCKPSCDPNPCHNGAVCHEGWGSYTCECINKLAHSGKHCEFNLNMNSATFIDGKEFFKDLETKSGNDSSYLSYFFKDDILLNIRTYIEKGLILYAHDHYNNFVQLHIENQNNLVFMFNSHREIVREFLKVPELSKGQPIQILIQRKSTYTVLQANDHFNNIDFPLALIDDYRYDPWTEGKELEMIKPPRPPVEPKPYLQYYIGGIDQKMVETKMEGFKGCISGLQIGNKIIDFKQMMSRDPGTEGIRIGCNLTCDAEPCKNGGHCIEQWKNRQRICDCTNSSYEGRSCDKDTASEFDGKTFIKYKFFSNPTYSSVKMRLAFSTGITPKKPSFLLFVNSKAHERNYIFIALLPDGRLKFEEDDGSKEVTHGIAVAESGQFMDNERHWVNYFRLGDNEIHLMVDGKEVVTKTTKAESNSSHTLDEEFQFGDIMDVVLVGGIDFKDERFGDYINFTGCLSNVMLELDDFAIYPFETAFAFRPGIEKTEIVGKIALTKCVPFRHSKFKTPTVSPMNLTMYKVPKWDPPRLAKIPFTPAPVVNHHDWSMAEANSKRVALGMGIFLLVLFIAIGVYLWRVDWRDKQFREEHYHNGIPLQNKKSKYSVNSNKLAFEFWKSPSNSQILSLNFIEPSKQQNYKNLEGRAYLTNSIAPEDLEWDHAADFSNLIPTNPPPSTDPSNALLSDTPNDDVTAPFPPSYDEVMKVQHCPKRFPSPVFMMERIRTFDNPLSYLGGPRIFYPKDYKSKITSSLLSLD